MQKIENSAQRRESARKIWAEIRAERTEEIQSDETVPLVAHADNGDVRASD